MKYARRLIAQNAEQFAQDDAALERGYHVLSFHHDYV